MLECQRCGHDVVCNYTILEKYRRFWLDLDQQVLFGTGLCQSLRQFPPAVERCAGEQCGLTHHQRAH